ncbi:hypothetical protein Scep_012856 [Stephania cephalantha]|uniref:Uncharacterized protein n=1 Tax=Stephania cephalantha TaxID=152367 RepID=A0AAP0P732_9MAGN
MRAFDQLVHELSLINPYSQIVLSLGKILRKPQFVRGLIVFYLQKSGGDRFVKGRQTIGNRV